MEEGRDPGNGENRNIDEIAAATTAATVLPRRVYKWWKCVLPSLPPPVPPVPSTSILSLLAILLSFSLFFSLVSSISSRFTYTSSPLLPFSQKDTAISTGAFPYSHSMVSLPRCRYSCFIFSIHKYANIEFCNFRIGTVLFSHRFNANRRNY